MVLIASFKFNYTFLSCFFLHQHELLLPWQQKRTKIQFFFLIIRIVYIVQQKYFNMKLKKIKFSTKVYVVIVLTN